jgi:hypothetical protein
MIAFLAPLRGNHRAAKEHPTPSGRHVDMSRPPKTGLLPVPQGRRRAEGDAR